MTTKTGRNTCLVNSTPGAPLGVNVVGYGYYLPDEVITNHDLAGMVDTSDQWILERTGIRSRHRAAKEQATSDLAIAAALERDNDRRRRKGLRPIRLRVGVTSGPVVVGDVGAPGRINYTVVGDTVNRAQRLEQLGREHMGPEEDCIILASEEIAAALPQGLARVERLGPCRLSGHTREIEVVRLYPLAAVARAAAAEAEGG